MSHSDSYSRVPGSKLLKAQTANKTQRLQQHRSICIFTLATHRALCTCGSSPWVSPTVLRPRPSKFSMVKGDFRPQKITENRSKRSASNEPPSLSLHLWQHFRFQDHSSVTSCSSTTLLVTPQLPGLLPESQWCQSRRNRKVPMALIQPILSGAHPTILCITGFWTTFTALGIHALHCRNSNFKVRSILYLQHSRDGTLMMAPEPQRITTHKQSQAIIRHETNLSSTTRNLQTWFIKDIPHSCTQGFLPQKTRTESQCVIWNSLPADPQTSIIPRSVHQGRRGSASPLISWPLRLHLVSLVSSCIRSVRALQLVECRIDLCASHIVEVDAAQRGDSPHQRDLHAEHWFQAHVLAHIPGIPHHRQHGWGKSASKWQGLDSARAEVSRQPMDELPTERRVVTAIIVYYYIVSITTVWHAWMSA